MKVAAKAVRNTVKFLLGAVTLAATLSVSSATAQAPYLLPYTIQAYAGGGTTPTTGGACAGAPANTSYDAFGDGCPITSSSVVLGSGADIHDVAVDQQGNVYVLDNGGNGVVRRIDARSGVITIYYGSLTTQTPCAATLDKYGDGCTSSDGKANATGGYTASDQKARGLGIARNGDLYIASYSGDVVHRIAVTTMATSAVAGFITGTGKAIVAIGVKGYTGDKGPANVAELNQDRGVGIDPAGNIYITDTGNNVIRKVTAATGIITTIAGSTAGTSGFTGDGGPATSATFAGPEGVQIDPAGNIFIADQGNVRVRVIYMSGTVVANLIAKTNPGTVAVAGNIYTIAGNATPGVTLPVPSTTNAGPVLATTVPIASPRKLSIDSHDNVFFADNGNNVIWFLDASTGYMRVIAGTLGLTTGGAGCAAKTDAFGDNCPGNTATINGASAIGVAVDNFGSIYITDTGDRLLRKVNTNQAFPTVINGASITQTLQVHYSLGDGPAATNPYVITGNTDFVVNSAASTCTTNVDTTQDCLVTITFTPRLPGREAASLTITSRLNGSSIVGISGTGAAASVAIDPGTVSSFATALTNPFGVAQDNNGNLYVADTGTNRILRFPAAGGTATVIAGTGTSGYTGDGALPTLATFNAPKAVAISRNGRHLHRRYRQ